MKNIYCYRTTSWLLLPALLLALAGCELFEYSPYEVRLKPEERNINEQHIARILAEQPSSSDTLTVALTADTQGFYADNDDMVHHMNHRDDIAFVLHAGDITDYGLLKEFRWIHRSLDRLRVPYVAVIGNHDAVGNGQDVYRAMFGKFDFSFAVGSSKFIFLNTNFLEFDFKAPDLDWLETQLQDRASYKTVFVVSHIPPTSFEFGEHNNDRYQRLLEKYNVSLSIHGHTHRYDFYKVEEEGVDHLTVATTNEREYMVMQIVGEQFKLERVNF
ncbi:metallophosphoesterase [Pontibacter qinzhouensis]|uniref:Metallophosphoesterase n=1 Tax=Pontibacter qinzhouensis TaxID=2603253 RepID=A0A5C8KDE3_9BACT|nr:metallophosphoesterase [Pontibacter qinzhouensis]TXK51887.1 metallophosphoesterase [Pontibacter qinzhouensis]